jgi:hypothetical protein
MSLFELFIYILSNVLSNTFPISIEVQQFLIPQFLSWPALSPELHGLIILGSAMGLFVVFIHDWAALISSFLCVIIYRKKPSSLDENLPFVILIALLPILIAQSHPILKWDTNWNLPNIPNIPMMTSGLASVIFLCTTFIFWLSDKLSHKRKNMSDWGILHGLLIGLAMASPIALLGTTHLPGWNFLAAGLFWCFLLGYQLQPSLKFLYLLIAPLLFIEAFQQLLSHTTEFSTSPLSTGLILLTSTTISFFSARFLISEIGNTQTNTLTMYRLLFASFFSLLHLGQWAISLI